MKTVFKNSQECAHIWASQSQQSGRANSTRFEGKKFYSYAANIAAFTDKGAVIVNNRHYSSTTNKHQSCVLRALPSDLKKFYVNVGIHSDILDHANNIDGYISLIKENEKLAINARQRKHWYIDTANAYKAELTDYIAYFEDEIRNISPSAMEEISKAGQLSDETKERLLKIAADEKKRKDKAERQYLKEQKANIKDWLSGEDKRFYGLKNAYLRLSKNGEHVETSSSASVPVKHAQTLYNAIQAKKDIAGAHVGPFEVKGIQDGILTIGCHTIEMKEVKRFAKLMNW